MLRKMLSTPSLSCFSCKYGLYQVQLQAAPNSCECVAWNKYMQLESYPVLFSENLLYLAGVQFFAVCNTYYLYIERERWGQEGIRMRKWSSGTNLDIFFEKKKKKSLQLILGFGSMSS